MPDRRSSRAKFLKSQRHEMFIREHLKLEGMNATEAYLRVVPPGVVNSRGSAAVIASRILRYPAVQRRYRELQARMARKADITIEKILTDYQRALDIALENGKPDSIVNAATAQAKLVGLLRDRVEAGSPGDFDAIDDIPGVLEKVANEAGPEAALALAKAMGIEAQITTEIVSEEPQEVDLGAIPAASAKIN